MSELVKKDKGDEVQVTNGQLSPITPMAMLQMAVSQGADIDKLQQLMELQERWEANEAKKEYVKAMAEFRAICPEIEKTKKAHNSNFAGLAETIEVIRGAMSACGLSHSWKTEQVNGLIVVTCCVTHVAGHKECTSLSAEPDTSGSKNKIQAVGSTTSYLERYTLFAVLGLASKEMDTDGNMPVEKIAPEQVKKINDLLKDTKSDETAFLKYCKVNKVEDIGIVAYSSILKMLERKKK